MIEVRRSERVRRIALTPKSAKSNEKNQGGKHERTEL